MKTGSNGMTESFGFEVHQTCRMTLDRISPWRRGGVMSAIALLAAVALAQIAPAVGDSAPIRIGVLAHKGSDTCKEMWQPTMVYLGKAIPGRQFDLAPLTFEEIEPAVKGESIDFLICNPAIYVDMEVKHGITRILTLRNRVGTQIVTEFGGVVFCRADRSDLRNLTDARGQRLAAADRTSFGGWFMALREFKAAGIDPERDCARLLFLGNHPAVVRSVLSGGADIGTVRTDTIERMVADGELRMDEIRVIPSSVAREDPSAFPYVCSTRLYPEWPLAKLRGTSDELASALAVALLSMPADSPAALAAQSGGWSVCLDYIPVHDCLRELRAPPYENYGLIGLRDLWRQYWPWMVAICSLVIALFLALLLWRGKRAVEEVHRLNAELDQRVVERTAQLDAANKELEAFSYSVSHDLRAPLRHVQGYVDMLGREAENQLSENGRRYMKTIADASREMGVLIDDLLAFSRMGRAQMAETTVSLNGLAQESIQSLEMVTRGRNIVWTIPPLPAVQGDPAMLRQVLANLLGNAVKYTRPRDPAEIELGCDGTEDGRLIFLVRDNGVGFDPQYAHKLFGVFQRLHRADEFEGTGIGLANVRRIIARHGGRTWAEGAVDKGATFYFTLRPSASANPSG
jgi:two-component system sensor histidine kinase/response regulator